MVEAKCAGREERSERVAGGFELVRVEDLLALWSAYRTGDVSLLALRTWCAAREMVHRRQSSARRTFTLEELAALVGSPSRERLRRALTELERASLLTGFPERPTFPRIAASKALLASFRRAPTSRIPVPRRMLRRLALSGQRIEVATVFAHLLRCLWYKRVGGQFVVVSGGSCSASWVARVFGVSRAEVIRARKALEHIGWLRRAERQDHWHRWRFGALSIVSLSWGEPAESAPVGASEITPHAAPVRTGFTPATHKDLSLRETKNQNPATGRPAGVQNRKSKEAEHPTLLDVKPEDLTDTDRLLELHRDAVSRGWTPDTHAARLETVALAERARRVGECPPALFRMLVEKGRRDLITDGDEERARRRLAALERAVPAFVRELLSEPEPAPVKALTRAEWAAMTELERAQHRLLQLRAEHARDGRAA